MSSILEGSKVIIDDSNEANRIHNKGYFGIPISGGGLELQLIEAAYLLENNKIEIIKGKKNYDLEDLIKHSTKIFPAFEIQYIVYRDLRSRGFVVKTNQENGFSVYERGDIPKKTPFKYKIIPLSERSPFIMDEIIAVTLASRSLRKDLIAAIVDEEGDLTYYSLTTAMPKPKVKLKKITAKGTAYFVEDRILVWDEKLMKQLHEYEFFGKLVGKSLQLSLMEGLYLLDWGIIELRNVKNNRKLSKLYFKRRAKSIQPDFELCINVYEQLKKQGLIVKTGFKYGTHFRVYKGDPDEEHSDYLIHAVPPNFSSNWPEISRAVRLAQGVRKDMLFARLIKKELQILKISRIKL